MAAHNLTALLVYENDKFWLRLVVATSGGTITLFEQDVSARLSSDQKAALSADQAVTPS